MSEALLVFRVLFFKLSPNLFSNRYLQFFTTMHNVTTFPNKGYLITLPEVNCYITVLQECKFTFKFYYICLIIINLSNVITVAIFVLIKYT
jgi:hypothetical protein